ncbi:MAG: hypothetical protein C4325_05805 [Blastocatellia bacterium]
MMQVVSSSVRARLHGVLLILLPLVLLVSAFGQAQVSTADLTGSVLDPNDAALPGVTVTVRNVATGFTRSTTSAADGSYALIGLPPGNYELTAEASGFKKISISPVRLTVGQSANFKIRLEVGTPDVLVNVSGDTVELIETGRTTVANTIDSERIQNLPINERSATGFALTLSTVGRDNGRPIGPAPTSGLNIADVRRR